MMFTTAMNIRKLRDLIDARGLRGQIQLAVGGAVFNLRPELVAEVRFHAWTADGILRQPAFLGLRADKDPHAVVRERPGRAPAETRVLSFTTM